MICPSCHKENPTGSRFCQYCGTSLLGAPAARTALAPGNSEYPASPPLDYGPAGATPSYRTEVSVPAPLQYERAPIGQLGAGGISALNIWGPFAGYGVRGRHVSWLLDELGERAEALHAAITERFRQRQIPSTRAQWNTLTGKGILAERRPFYFVQRGITTIALYIARFGKDLFISQVTYAKGPFSNVRILILAAMVVLAVLAFVGSSSALVSGTGGGDPFSINLASALLSTLALCLLVPLGLLDSFLLFLIFLYCGYKWLTERDFWAILRTPPNEFQLDDINALEKAVEETVRQSLDELGIDVKLMPPAQEKSFATRRLI